MTEGIEESYANIADAIVTAVPEPWTEAKVEAIFFADSIDFEAEYKSEAGKDRSFAVSMAGTRAFRELRRRFKDAGQPVWGQACFVLRANGKFSMKWGYDNCDENGDTVFSAEEWHKRHEERRQRLSRP